MATGVAGVPRVTPVVCILIQPAREHGQDEVEQGDEGVRRRYSAHAAQHAQWPQQGEAVVVEAVSHVDEQSHERGHPHEGDVKQGEVGRGRHPAVQHVARHRGEPRYVHNGDGGGAPRAVLGKVWGWGRE